MYSRRFVMVCLSLAVGCGGDSVVDGPADARITADAFAWNCDDGDLRWVGTQHFFVDLQHAPGWVQERALPEPGQCANWSPMFAKDDYLPGTSFEASSQTLQWKIQGLDEANGRIPSGTMQHVGAGFWQADVYEDFQTCFELDTVMVDGVAVEGQGDLEGIRTPLPGTVASVELDQSTFMGLPDREPVTLTWEASGWDEQFAMVRRERGGMVVESLVCNVTSLSSFTLDESFWSLGNEHLGHDQARLFLGFRNAQRQATETGMEVELLTRAMWSIALVDAH